MTDRHGNVSRTTPRKPDVGLTLRKVPADSVPYGDSISRNGVFVWAAYEGDRLVCVAATADEARRRYRALKRHGAENLAERS